MDNTSINSNYRAGSLGRLLYGTACLAALVLLTSCNSKKYLTEDQSFLRDNKLTIKSKHKIANKPELYEDLLLQYVQQETKTVAGIPRHVFYYQLLERIRRDSLNPKWNLDKYQNKLIRNRPVIYDSLKSVQTLEKFGRYLALRGYRNSQSSFKATTRDKETIVRYHVDPGPRIYIDTFLIIADDPSLQAILDSIPGPEFIRPGSPLDIQLYNQERTRIVKIYQNLGYATIDQNYIGNLEVDTANNRVKTIMRLRNPSDSTYHKQYTVGSITIYPDITSNTSYQPVFYDTIVSGIKYYLPGSLYFTLKPEAIKRNVALLPGNRSTRDAYEQTVRGLSRMDLIKFVNTNYTLDTTTRQIDYVFQLERKKKINLQANVELTYSNVAVAARRSLLGTAVALDYRDRNMFRGAEVFGLNLETGFEFNLLDRETGEDEVKQPLLNSVNIGASSNLTFPRFLDPFRLYNMIGYTRHPTKKALMGNRLREWLKTDATTRLNLGYNYVSIQDLYEYYTLNANLSYAMQPDALRTLTINRIGFDLFVPDPKPAFDNILKENRFQRESFGKQLYTGLLFRDYLFRIITEKKGKQGFIDVSHSVELSGLEVYALNRLVSPERKFALRTNSDTGIDSIEFSHFAKAEIDFDYIYKLGRGNRMMFKVNTGVASSYGIFTNQVPYLKQFYVGGASSNRAWQIRELGPGSFRDPNPVNEALPFYQTGDIKIDLSMEYEFKLFWPFLGAVFVDASNVWTLKYDSDRPGSQFNWSSKKTDTSDGIPFYREFGVGYGFGVRADFDFFLIRFDLGYKLFSPYEVEYLDNGVPKTNRFLFDEVRKFPGGGEPQIAIGRKF